jgi:hypothetical protein
MVWKTTCNAVKRGEQVKRIAVGESDSGWPINHKQIQDE